MLILEIKRTYKQRRKIMKFENCKAASSEIRVEGMRSATSVRDAANRLSRTKYMASEVIVKYNDLFNMQIGNLLGGMKATLDTLPESYAMHQKVNNVPLNEWIKQEVNERVFFRFLQMYKNKEDYLEAMKRQRELLRHDIMLGEYEEEFANKLIARIFPNGIDKFVTSFACAYNTTFHMIANESGVQTAITEPMTQDIWRNWEYFWNPEENEYRLDGEFAQFYDGEEFSQELDDGNRLIKINEGVYEALKNVKRT